jgi:hypothetical protein
MTRRRRFWEPNPKTIYEDLLALAAARKVNWSEVRHRDWQQQRASRKAASKKVGAITSARRYCEPATETSAAKQASARQSSG